MVFKFIKLIPTEPNVFSHSRCIPGSKKWQSTHTHYSSLTLLLLINYSNGLNGTISVYPLEGPMAGMMPTPASANSPVSFTILDVDQNAYLFVGGILGTAKVLFGRTIMNLSVFLQVFLFSSFLCLLESRSSSSIYIHRLHGRDLLGR